MKYIVEIFELPPGCEHDYDKYHSIVDGFGTMVCNKCGYAISEWEYDRKNNLV